MRSLNFLSTSNPNSNIQKTIKNNSQLANKKLDPPQPEILHNPILKKLKPEEKQIKTIKAQNNKNKESRPFFSQPAPTIEKIENSYQHNKTKNVEEREAMEEEECYYVDESLEKKEPQNKKTKELNKEAPIIESKQNNETIKKENPFSKLKNEEITSNQDNKINRTHKT
jgi:hypothetical protein